MDEDPILAEELAHERSMVDTRDVYDRTILALLIREYVQDIVDEWKRIKKESTRAPHLVLYLRDLPDIAPAVTSALAALLARLLNNTALSKASAAQTIGSTIAREVRLYRWSVMSPRNKGIHKVISKRIQADKQGASAGGVLADMNKAWRIQSRVASRFGWFDEPLPKHKRMVIGLGLLEVIQQVTPLFSFYKKLQGVVRGRPRYLWMVGLSDRTMEWISRTKERMGDHLTMKPMLIVPRKWDTWDSGGYELFGRTFMKWRNNATPVGNRMEAVNILQDVAYEVHPWLCQIVLDMQKHSHKLAPKVLEYVAPPRPPEGATKDELRAYGDAREQLHQDVTKSIQEVGNWERTLKAAEEHLGRAIYYPHQCDSRGRIYPIPTVIRTQGESLEKALLRSYTGLPIGKHGAYWLATHVAGTWGLDKEPWDTRAAWTQENTDWILDVAVDPWPHLEEVFARADDPWAFLAACHEWMGFIEEGEDFITKLPITQDATCSGFQHQAGLMLDPHTAGLVNLRGGPRQDVYKAVAEAARDILLLDDNEFAALWLEVGIDRALAKRPTMIQPYAGTRMAMGDDSCQEYLKRLKAGLTRVAFGPGKHDHHNAGIYLGRVWWDAIQQVVPGGSAYMRWASLAGRDAAREGHHLSWGIPDDTSYPQCSQAYYKQRSRAVKSTLYGRARIWYREDTSVPDAQKARQATAPNIIHWLDSQQLSTAAIRNRHDGVHFQTVVHDQHGVLAPDVDTMRKNLLTSFHDMYRTDNQEPLIQRLHQGMRQLTGCDLPEPPEVGSWDPQEVLESAFAYS
jgi:DNA-directed RNA polymerase